MSKKHKAQHEAITSGFASSVAFTPVKGIELINPDLNKFKKPSDPKDGYFSTFRKTS